MKYKLTGLIIALAVLSLSACSLFGDNNDPFFDLREQIRATVHDQEHAEAMVASIDRLDQLLLESAELLSSIARQERLLFYDYDSSPEDFESLFSEGARKRQELQDEMLDVHLEFKASATAEEWEVILPVHAAAVSSRVQTLVVAAADERR